MLHIIHKKSNALSREQWETIRKLNRKIIPNSLYDQNLFTGGCLESTCESAILKAIEMGTAEILFGFKDHQLISYMIFYCTGNPPTLEGRLQAYYHLGRVGYSDMLVVDPKFQKRGYAKEMRKHMKQIARESGIDVFMTFVRAIPIPNLPSLMSLHGAGAVFSNNQLVLQRQLPGMEQALTDICYELIYPTDDRYLTTDKTGKIIWE